MKNKPAMRMRACSGPDAELTNGGASDDDAIPSGDDGPIPDASPNGDDGPIPDASHDDGPTALRS